MRRLALAAVAALAALPAAAQEGGPIRTGEHPTFTRVVMAVAPTTEWALETGADEAVIFFPGRRLDFGVEGAFARIPRTRVTRIEAEATEAGTRVAVAIACDCRVSASFVGGRYLALDVTDRDAPRPAAAPDLPQEDPALLAARQAGTVASAEAALIEQIARAADQGVVVMAPPPGAQAQAEAAPAPAAQAAQTPEADAPAPAASQAAPPATAEAAPLAAAPAPETLAELALVEQIEAITVYDRDGAALAARRPAPEPPAPCIADEALDVGRWADGAPMRAQTPALMRRLVGEFDRPDPEALRALARLYVRFGFGLEAENLLAQFEADLPDRALLVGLARAVEGRPAAGGPLALALACPGRHGLWLAAGGAAPAFHDAEHFATVQEAFADLPADLRALIGPGLATRLLEAGRKAEARLIQVTATRLGQEPTPALRLSEARLLAAEGKAPEAIALLRPLAESNAAGAQDALALRTRIALDAGFAPPGRVLTDLRAAALEQRGDPPREAMLRGLLVEALALRGDLAGALAEARAARADLPGAGAMFTALAAAALGAADPDRVGAGVFAAAALSAGDLIPAAPEADPARRAVAGRLIALGLPNGALEILAPPLGREDPGARRLAARAHLALANAAPALAALEGLGDAEAVALRAAALARSGAPAEALALLDAAGAGEAALPYAWPSGAWTRARAATDDPARAAMAGFMAAREGAAAAPAPPADPEALTPEAAFEAPLPPLAEPSLGASRALLAAGRQVGGFLQGLLAAE